MRTVGLDVGERRLGVAISDEMGWTAQPLAVIDGRSPDEHLNGLTRALAGLEVGAVVVGLPKNMDGSEGPSCRRARDFGALAAARFDVPVEYWDERLTTVAAERVLLEADLSRAKRKTVIDKVAAALILQGWLNSRSEGRR